MRGYDNLDINHNMVLDLPFREGGGVITQDRSKNHYPFTLTGVPAWGNLPASGIPWLDFTAATPDYLTCPIATCALLDFTSEDFSIASWINPDSLVGDLTLLCHGLAVTDGYYIEVLANGSVQFASNQGGAAQQLVISAVGDIIINTWTLLGISRTGTALQIFINGLETVYVAQPAITDPLTSARAVLFGAYNDLSNPWSQYMGRQRAWLNRQLAVDDHRFIWNTERHWYGG